MPDEKNQPPVSGTITGMTDSSAAPAQPAPVSRRRLRGIGAVLWIIAVILMLGSAVYQRLTGPTHPLRGHAVVAGQSISYKLIRSEVTGTEAKVSLPDPGNDVIGLVYWKRYKTADEFQALPMTIDQGLGASKGKLVAELPSQPPAGKLQYYITLQTPQGEVRIPADRDVVMRYKGAVPASTLIAHICFMFFAVLLGIRALLEGLFNLPGIRWMSNVTLLLMFIGGMILGPVVQKYAFGVYWSGVPFGWDLTDNKVLLMFLCWVIAVLAIGLTGKVRRCGRWSMVVAAIVMLLVYLIPHSMYGSELKYDKVDSGVAPEQAVGQGQ